jgi:hypothetical protein
MFDGNSVNTPYIEFVLGGVRKAYLGYATTTTMDLFSANGATLQLGSENVSRMTINPAGNVNIATNLTVASNSTGGSLIVNGGGSYVEGCLYSDANWGMLLRGKVPGNIAEFDFRNSVGTTRMRIEPTVGYVSIGDFSASYKLHVGGADGNIRAEGSVYCDRYYSSNPARQIVLEDLNPVNWITNASGPKPIPFTHSSWGNGGYTVVSMTQSNTGPGLGFGNSTNDGYGPGGRSVIISLAPAVQWGELILSAGITYIASNGTIHLYTNGGGWIFISDQRCKKDIKDIKTARSLERIMALKPKTYKKIYPENPDTPISDKVRNADHIGFLAQDVMETNPHCIDEWVDDKCVCDGDDGKRLGIAYGDINIHMVGAIQELKKQNDAQQKEIDELKELVRQLMDRVRP